MSLYIVKNNAAGGKTVSGQNALIVSAADPAGAILMAADHFDGDSSWSDAVATALIESDLDAASSCVGYTFKVLIRGAAAQTADPIEISVTPTGTEDLDDMAALMVIALNAHAEIAAAVYSAPNLTVAAIADGLGDASVEFQVYRTAGHGADLGSEFHTAVTDEGIAAADLVVALVADTVIEPQVVDAVARV